MIPLDRSRRAIVFAVSTLSLASAAALAAPTADAITDAAADVASEVENSKFQFEGEVNANAVYVRSGANENDYATAKLDKGARVTVVGIKFEWLKILPPENSFCYVAKAYVQKRGDGTIGRVTSTLNVRVGSNLVPMKTKVASRLEPGQDVQILGEQDEYFKVKPPAGVFFYVNKQFVDPVRRVEVPGITSATGGEKPVVTETPTDAVAKTGDKPAGESVPPVTPTPDAGSTPVAHGDAPSTDAASHDVKIPAGTELPSNSGVALTEPPVTPIDTPAAPAGSATPGDAPVGADALAVGPSTQPTTPAVSADLRFDQLEEQLKLAATQKIEDQPVPELLAGYTALAGDPSLPDSMRRIAELRVGTLKIHNENRELALAHRRDVADKEAKRLALKAEGEELMQRLKNTGIIYYTAVGTLRPSSLQVGDGTLYRLTDPLTGRLLVYVKSDDPSLARMDGLFIGIRGDLIDDATSQLKWVNANVIEPIDQTKVNRSVTARFIPPSLQPGGRLADVQD